MAATHTVSLTVGGFDVASYGMFYGRRGRIFTHLYIEKKLSACAKLIFLLMF